MLIHILIIDSVVTLNISKDDQFVRGSHLTEILSQQTVPDRNKNLVMFLEQSMRRIGMLHLGVMTRGCNWLLRLNLGLQKRIMK